MEQIDGSTTGLTNSSEVEDLLQADSRQAAWSLSQTEQQVRWLYKVVGGLERKMREVRKIWFADLNKQLSNLKATDSSLRSTIASQNKQLANLKATDNSLRSTINSRIKSLTASINAVSSRMIRCSAGWSKVSTSYKKLYYGTFKSKPAFTAAVSAATGVAKGFWLTYQVEKSFAKVRVVHGVNVEIGWIACGY